VKKNNFIIKKLLKEIGSLRDKKGFIRAGRPRFNRLFGRDSLIVSWQLLDFDSEIAKETLKILAEFQGKKINYKREEEPGKILHETQLNLRQHSDNYLPFPYYGSIDSTPLFLILFSFYFKKTKDNKFLKKYWSNILAAINWVINYGDKDGDGFLEYQRKNPRGLFHQGWKDSFKNHLNIQLPVAIVEAQGYQYFAFKKIAKLSRILGDNKLEKALMSRAESLKKNFNEKFWIEEEKYFALALNRKKAQKKTITSNPGHLLFTGIVNKDKVDSFIKRIFKKDIWTPYGIRTHSQGDPDFNPISYHLGSIWPHDNWIIAQGLKKLGFKEEYLKIKKALLRAYQKLGKIPELYSVIDNKIVEIPGACYPQAWATGALINFLNAD